MNVSHIANGDALPDLFVRRRPLCTTPPLATIDFPVGYGSSDIYSARDVANLIFAAFAAAEAIKNIHSEALTDDGHMPYAQGSIASTHKTTAVNDTDHTMKRSANQSQFAKLLLLPTTLTIVIYACRDRSRSIGSSSNHLVIGTNSRDVIVGTSGCDVIVGGTGKDVIRGFDENDIICTGTGDDTIVGGNGYARKNMPRHPQWRRR